VRHTFPRDSLAIWRKDSVTSVGDFPWLEFPPPFRYCWFSKWKTYSLQKILLHLYIPSGSLYGKWSSNAGKNSQLETSISCRWQARTAHCITMKVQVDAQCDKLATELSTKLTTLLSRKSPIFSYLTCTLPSPPAFVTPVGGNPVRVLPNFRHQKN